MNKMQCNMHVAMYGPHKLHEKRRGDKAEQFVECTWLFHVNTMISTISHTQKCGFTRLIEVGYSYLTMTFHQFISVNVCANNLLSRIRSLIIMYTLLAWSL